MQLLLINYNLFECISVMKEGKTHNMCFSGGRQVVLEKVYFEICPWRLRRRLVCAVEAIRRAPTDDRVAVRGRDSHHPAIIRRIFLSRWSRISSWKKPPKLFSSCGLVSTGLGVQKGKRLLVRSMSVCSLSSLSLHFYRRHVSPKTTRSAAQKHTKDFDHMPSVYDKFFLSTNTTIPPF